MPAGTEIERKFLVAAMPDLAAARATPIRQGYVTRPEDSIEVRLRQKGEAYLVTIKSGEGMVRGEHETAIPRAAFDALWPAVSGTITKTRWTGQLPDGHVYEIDIFDAPHAPLVVVEVEFPSEAAAHAFVPPDWFGREVSGEKAYSNKVLAFGG
ncbi:CYTH domain-containing protein [Pseudooceanicola sp. LIPI14-2-Ac024]|uniref:CYTH domain-containing protein n=1 Tax=Pseudooceanicola sp. LIPI14-2-Ac024 TaxID=3344875 RepID=UPI0035CF1C07